MYEPHFIPPPDSHPPQPPNNEASKSVQITNFWTEIDRDVGLTTLSLSWLGVDNNGVNLRFTLLTSGWTPTVAENVQYCFNYRSFLSVWMIAGESVYITSNSHFSTPRTGKNYHNPLLHSNTVCDHRQQIENDCPSLCTTINNIKLLSFTWLTTSNKKSTQTLQSHIHRVYWLFSNRIIFEQYSLPLYIKLFKIL